MKTKNCGNCVNFLKMKNDKYSGGLCLEKDGRVNSDDGHKCKDWWAMKYERPKKIQIKDLTFD